MDSIEEPKQKQIDSNTQAARYQDHAADEDKIFVEIKSTPTSFAWSDEEKSLAWSDGMVVWNTEEKQCVHYERDTKEFFEPPQAYIPIPGHSEPESKPKRVCELRRLILILSFLIVIFVTALSIGLAIGLTRHASNNKSKSRMTSDYNVGGSLDPRYYSKGAAFNGSGIALNEQTIGIEINGNKDFGGDSDLVVYYQHYDTTVRWMRLHDGEWSGGGATETLANDAKNNTPISATSYQTNLTSEWHVFYVDKNNQIREKTSSNLTSVWAEGALSQNNLYAFDTDVVGMSACLYGNVYNDSDYTSSDLTKEQKVIGIHLRYVSDNQTVKQYGWREHEEEWTFQYQWNNITPHANIGCNSWGYNAMDYVMLVNQDNATEIWGKDAAVAPNEWKDMTPTGLDKVHPSTSFAYNGVHLYSQDLESNLIQGYNISWGQTNTSILQRLEIEGYPAVPGSHFGATTLPLPSDSNTEPGSPTIFYQADGNDISYLSQNLTTGIWTKTTIPIPYT